MEFRRSEPAEHVVGRRWRADEDHHRYDGAAGDEGRRCRYRQPWRAAGKISHSINLGVTSTGPLRSSRVAHRRQGRDRRCHPAAETLDEQNIPESGRWVVLPTWATTLIKMSELREAYLSGDATSICATAASAWSTASRSTSNLLPAGTAAGLVAGEYLMYAGYAHGLTFASQMTKMETMRPSRPSAPWVLRTALTRSSCTPGDALLDFGVTANNTCRRGPSLLCWYVEPPQHCFYCCRLRGHWQSECRWLILWRFVSGCVGWRRSVYWICQ